MLSLGPIQWAGCVNTRTQSNEEVKIYCKLYTPLRIERSATRSPLIQFLFLYATRWFRFL